MKTLDGKICSESMDINNIGLGRNGKIFPRPIDMERCSGIVRDAKVIVYVIAI
jgi:hypothetical protein